MTTAFEEGFGLFLWPLALNEAGRLWSALGALNGSQGFWKAPEGPGRFWRFSMDLCGFGRLGKDQDCLGKLLQAFESFPRHRRCPARPLQRSKSSGNRLWK